MRYLRNDTNQKITFMYAHREYEFDPGESKEVPELAIDHYEKRIGGSTRLTIVEHEIPNPGPVPEAKVEENVPSQSGDLSELTWNDLRKVAKAEGIKTFGKKRDEIERELTELE